VFDTVKVWWCI